jgi:plastocyanin
MIAMPKNLKLGKLVIVLALTSFLSPLLTHAQETNSVTHRVDITNFAFDPPTLIIKPGDSVVWTNRDVVPHTATASDHSWDTGEIGPNKSKRLLFDSVAKSPYYCFYHPTMIARLEFTELD